MGELFTAREPELQLADPVPRTARAGLPYRPRAVPSRRVQPLAALLGARCADRAGLRDAAAGGEEDKDEVD